MIDPYTRAGMQSARASAERAIRALDLVDDCDDRWTSLCRQVDPARAIRNLTQEECVGADREASDELDRKFRRTEPNAVTIPWETLAYRAQRAATTRAALVAGPAGALVPTLNYPNAAGALLSLLILGRLGATGISSSANLSLPRVTSPASVYWLSTEQSSVTESDQNFGQLAFSPKTVGGYTEMSRLLTLQSNPDAGDVIATDLTRKIRRAIEAAAFNASGINGQPKGILSTTGVGTLSGTSFALSTAASAVTDIGDALSPDASPAWAANKSVAITLRQRQEFTNGTRTLWEGPATEGTISDYYAAASSGVPSATAIFGAWKYLTLVDFGGGLVVSVNPYGSNAYGGGSDAANFQRGIIGMRCFASLDVGVVWPSAFTAVTSIT
jgi:HK97 family phage major capsid protein